jgi:hypothetical protein
MVTINTKQPDLTIFHPNPDGSMDKAERHTYVTHTDYMPRTGAFIGSGDVTGQVVWLGDCDRSKLDPSFANKIILCRPLPGASSRLTIEKMLEYRIGGLLVIWEVDGPYARSGYGIGDLIDMPAFRISRAIAEDILAGDRYTLEDLDQLEIPTPLAATVHMAATFEMKVTRARNVLGLLPGNDPLHRSEIVIISAHYDHVGCDPDGTIYHGANDNASGVAVMLEIARLWQVQGFRPARSVVFAAWDAEEQGLNGSRQYVSDPIKPLDQTSAMLNLEMTGVGDTVSIAGQGAMADQLQASAVAFGYPAEVDPAGGSDDIPFEEVGVPAGCFSINPATFAEVALHRPEDDLRIIKPESLRRIGILSAHALAAWSGGEPTRL